MFQQVGPVSQSLAQLLLPSPATNLAVISAEQDLRHVQAAKLRGPRVVGIIEQASGAVLGAGNTGGCGSYLRIRHAKAFVLPRSFIAQHTGNVAHCRVHYDGCGQGVERIFPFNSKVIDKIEKVRSYKVRRAKLFYIRGLRGKAARLKEVDHVAAKA